MDYKPQENIEQLGEAINRLDEIKDELEILVEEAAKIVRTTVGRRELIYQRAEAHWIYRMKQHLNDDNQSYGSMEETINDMEKRREQMKKEAKEDK